VILVMLDRLNMEMKEPEKNPGERFRNSGTSMQLKYQSQNDSFISSNFSWLLKSELECPTCNLKSETFDPCVSLPLTLPLPPSRHRMIRVIYCSRMYWFWHEISFRTTKKDVVDFLRENVDFFSSETLFYSFRYRNHTFEFARDLDLYDLPQDQIYVLYAVEGASPHWMVCADHRTHSGSTFGFPLIFSVDASFVSHPHRELTEMIQAHVKDWFDPLSEPMQTSSSADDVVLLGDLDLIDLEGGGKQDNLFADRVQKVQDERYVF
jgi:hypothetical protein